jgi:hypothetical protein
VQTYTDAQFRSPSRAIGVICQPDHRSVQFDDAFWHIANFFTPAVVSGYLAAGAAKLFWRRELATAGWLRLGAWASGAMAGVAVLGLVVFEHDGKMVTYAAMVVACALALWWAGFRRR